MQRRDDLTDIPRTKAWAKFCRDALGAKSWYVVENALETGARGRDIKGRICQRGKWTDYAKGIHVPRERLTEQVELLIPGSLGVLTHPVWQIRDLPPERAAETANRFFSALSLEVGQRLFHRTNELHSGRKRITQQTLVFLETQQDLSGLGALAMIVLEASWNENKRLAFQAGCVLFRALLRQSIAGPPWLILIATDLFELFRQRVFPYAADLNFRICLDGVDFPTLAKLVRFACDYTTEEKKHFSRDIFFSKLFDQPWMTQVGYLTLLTPTKSTNVRARAGAGAGAGAGAEQDDHCQLIRHWEDTYAKYLQLRTLATG
jgi:hypothetical protein